LGRFVADVGRGWYHGGIGDLAAGVTFWVLVSLPAATLALLATLGSLDTIIDYGFETRIEQNLLDFVATVFTDENGGVQEAVAALFDQTNSELLTISLVVALWSISRGFAGLIRALEDIYHVVDGRSWYYTRVVAVFLGVGSLLISVPLVMLERLVWDKLEPGPLEELLRNVVSLAVLIAWASTIYHFGPAARSRWRHDLPGALVAAAMWWVLSISFGWYVRPSSGANGVTAAVGAGLLALTWLWLVAQVLLIGGTVNFLYGQRRSITRNRRSWSLNKRIMWSTGELRRIVASEPSPVEPAPPPVAPGRVPPVPPVPAPVPPDQRPIEPEPGPEPGADPSQEPERTRG
jgi:membrane protein